MLSLKIIGEHATIQDDGLLANCWSDPQSFVFIPDKSGVSSNWLEHAVSLIPQSLHIGCFGLLTSGSTGAPKLIIGERQRAMDLAHILHQCQASETVVETLCILPLTYSYAFINQFVWSTVFNRRLLVTKGFAEPDNLKAQLLKLENAMLCLVGGQIPLIHQYFPESVFPGIIRLHFAGGRFPQSQLEFLRQRFPNAQIFNNYGCAEAMPRLTLRRAEEAIEADDIGRPLPNIELRVDEQKRLHFRSPYAAVAYVDDAGFHAIDKESWTPSGDLAEPLKNGHWRLLGRTNEVFKRYGEKISIPQLLNTVTQAWPGEAVFYQEVDRLGEQACVLVLSPQPSQDEVRALLMAMRRNHTRPHWPLRIESLANIPMLPNNKTDVQALTQLEDKPIHWRQRI